MICPKPRPNVLAPLLHRSQPRPEHSCCFGCLVCGNLLCSLEVCLHRSLHAFHCTAKDSEVLAQQAHVFGHNSIRRLGLQERLTFHLECWHCNGGADLKQAVRDAHGQRRQDAAHHRAFGAQLRFRQRLLFTQLLSSRVMHRDALDHELIAEVLHLALFLHSDKLSFNSRKELLPTPRRNDDLRDLGFTHKVPELLLRDVSSSLSLALQVLLDWHLSYGSEATCLACSCGRCSQHMGSTNKAASAEGSNGR
mmetsp:Transcript_62818/g.147351  ORF Transcript_62818/g.147351 Transcript_62818/m.147351 type:complete len:251 (-) Transcript_62818:53-805(-)